LSLISNNGNTVKLFNVFIHSILRFWPVVGYSDRNDYQISMKFLVKIMMNFLRREWFLLVALATIALIIFLFEIL